MAPFLGTMEVAMIQRLVFLIVGCAVLAAVLALLRQFLFPDVVPYMPGEDAGSGWRREAAFLVTALAWLAAEVSGLLSIVLAVRLWQNRSAKLRSN
jgi:hypothetical protein